MKFILAILLCLMSIPGLAQYDEEVGGLNYENGVGTSYDKSGDIYDTDFSRQEAENERNDDRYTHQTSNTDISGSKSYNESRDEDDRNESCVNCGIGNQRPDESDNSDKQNDRSAVLRGFQNAEWSHSTNNPATEFHSGNGYQYNYERAFRKGVHSYYEGNNIPEERRSIPSGIMEAAIQKAKQNGKEVSKEDVERARKIDEYYRQNDLIISVPGKSFDHPEFTKNLDPIQRYALDYSIVVVTHQVVMNHGLDTSYVDANGFTRSASSGGVVLDHFHGAFPGGISYIDRETFLGNLGGSYIDIVEEEIRSQGERAIYRNAYKAIQDGNLSPKELDTASVAYSMAGFLATARHVSEVGAFNVYGKTVPEDTLEKASKISPDFVKKEDYIFIGTEMTSKSAARTVGELGQEIKVRANSKGVELTSEEAENIAQIIKESPTVKYANEWLGEFVSSPISEMRY